jgi:hypothetical protein
MRPTEKKPPVLLRWLSFERRHAIAVWIRDRAADWAEWICPEIADENQPDGE